MTPDEQRLFRLYGKLPNRNDLLQKKFQVREDSLQSTAPVIILIVQQERKYFDSGDYALSKAGKASDAGVTTVGSQHPVPENIPHLASPTPNGSGAPGSGNSNGAGAAQHTHQGSVSPVKESRFKSEEEGKAPEEQGKLAEDTTGQESNPQSSSVAQAAAAATAGS